MIETFLRLFAVEVLRPQVDQHEMILRPAGHDAVTVLRDARGESLRVNHDLSLVITEPGLQSFVKTNGFCRDHVHERATLHARKDGRVDLLCELLLAHDDAATRTA